MSNHTPHTTPPTFYPLYIASMEHTAKQMRRFNTYKEEILNLQSVGDYIRQNISGRIRTHSPDELPDDLKLELDSIATETIRELRRLGLDA